jgi:hypothetical protein
MNKYEITFEDIDGEIWVEIVYADTLRKAKQICKDYHSVKKFL